MSTFKHISAHSLAGQILTPHESLAATLISSVESERVKRYCQSAALVWKRLGPKVTQDETHMTTTSCFCKLPHLCTMIDKGVATVTDDRKYEQWLRSLQVRAINEWCSYTAEIQPIIWVWSLAHTWVAGKWQYFLCMCYMKSVVCCSCGSAQPSA